MLFIWLRPPLSALLPPKLAVWLLQELFASFFLPPQLGLCVLPVLLRTLFLDALVLPSWLSLALFVFVLGFFLRLGA